MLKHYKFYRKVKHFMSRRKRQLQKQEVRATKKLLQQNSPQKWDKKKRRQHQAQQEYKRRCFMAYM